MTILSEVSAAATAIGVVIAAVGIIAQTAQRREQLAQAYVTRFWTLLDRNPGTPLADYEPYLQLCEDELDIVRLGWIRGSTWEVWHQAITTAIPSPIHDSVRPGQLKLLRMCRGEPVGHAGYACPGLHRMLPSRRAVLRVSGWGARRFS